MQKTEKWSQVDDLNAYVLVVQLVSALSAIERSVPGCHYKAVCGFESCRGYFSVTAFEFQ